MANLKPKTGHLSSIQTRYTTTWNNLPTVTIRVPRDLAAMTLEYAHELDESPSKNGRYQDSPLKDLDALIEKIRLRRKGYKTTPQRVLSDLKKIRGRKS